MMNKRRVYLILQAAVCVALVALMALSAVSICRDGMARKALDPLERVYSPEIVAERFAPIAPLLAAGLVLLAVGLALGLKDERAERPVRDPLWARDLAAARVRRPSDAMLREQTAQRWLRWIGRGAFALSMVPVAIFLADPARFPAEDPEAMLSGLTRILAPCAALGLVALAATAVLRERSALREIEAARARAREEAAMGPTPMTPEFARPKSQGVVRAALLAAAAALIVAGILNGSARDVLYKAITICSECIGLG